jgi:hypothetical protein
MMPDRGRTEREVWKGALTPTEACPTIEELGLLSNGLLSEQPSSGAHIAECLRCQAELAMLKEFQSGPTLPAEAAEVSWITAELERRFDRIVAPTPLTSSGSTPDRRRSLWWHRLFDARSVRVAAFGSAVLIGVIAAALHFRGAQEPKLTADLGRGPAVLRSGDMVALGPTGDLTHAPGELRWQAMPGAKRYGIRVMEVDQNELWHTESVETSVSLPAAVRATIVPGKTLLWQVTALDSASKPMAASQILRFRLSVGASSPKE